MRQRLLTMWIGALWLCVCQGQTTAPAAKPLEFEVASVKPSASDNRGTSMRIENGALSVTGATLRQLIFMAYEVKDFQISGGPGWIGTDRFDIEAKFELDPAAPDPKSMNDEQRKHVNERFKESLRSLLTDRFQLQVSQSTSEMPIYALVQAKSGSRLAAAQSGDAGRQGMRIMRGTMSATSSTMESLANSLSGMVGRPVIDKTGLQGKYDWKLEWTPESGQNRPQVPGESPASANSAEISGPSVFTALQEQLGLKLESRKGPALALVIDHAEKPSAN